MNKRNDLKEYVKYTLLNVIGMLGLSCYILVDTFFISKRLGADGLTALNLAIPIYSLIHGSGLMLGMGGATKYSIFKGQKEAENADRVFVNSVYSAAVPAAVFMLTGLSFSSQITLLLGADAGVADMTDIYLKMILLFSPAFMMNDVLICFVRNDGNPRLAMLAMLAGSFSNIVLDYIFIFSFNMGMFGAVLATGMSPIISMLILSVHKLKRKNEFHFRRLKPHPETMLSNISLGFPSLITEAASGIVILVFNAIMLEQNGNVGVAAYGVIANLSLVVVAVYTGIAQGIQPLISKAYGEGEWQRIRRNLRYGIATILILSAVIYLIMFAEADLITGIFNSEGNAMLQKIAELGIKLYFMAVPFVGFNIVISSYFTSTEKAFPAQLISLARGLVLIIPMAFFLSSVAGITGVWLAFPVTEGIVCILGLIDYFRYSAADRYC